MQDEEYAEDAAHQVPSVHQDIDNFANMIFLNFEQGLLVLPNLFDTQST